MKMHIYEMEIYLAVLSRNNHFSNVLKAFSLSRKRCQITMSDVEAAEIRDFWTHINSYKTKQKLKKGSNPRVYDDFFEAALMDKQKRNFQ